MTTLSEWKVKKAEIADNWQWYVRKIDVHTLDFGMDYALLKELVENLEWDVRDLDSIRQGNALYLVDGYRWENYEFKYSGKKVCVAEVEEDEELLSILLEMMKRDRPWEVEECLRLEGGYVVEKGTIHRGVLPPASQSRFPSMNRGIPDQDVREPSAGFIDAFVKPDSPGKLKTQQEQMSMAQLEVQTRAALEFMEDILRKRVIETNRLDASFNRFFTKVVVGCSVRIWFKVSLLVLLMKLEISGVKPLMIAVGTSIFHVAVGSQPYVQIVWNALALSAIEKRKRLATVFLLLIPFWMSLVRLLGIYLCPSKLFNFSNFGCVDEHVFAIASAAINGTSTAAITCPVIGWHRCSIAYAEIVGAVFAVYMSHFAWMLLKVKTNMTQDKNEPLLGAGGQEGYPDSTNPIREKDEVDHRLAHWLWVLGSVEFVMVPVFLFLGFHQFTEIGTHLIYMMYAVVCIVNYWVTVELASMHLELKDAWSAKWRERLQVPFIGIGVPISPLWLTFVLGIPAFTDNSMLSLAIGNVQAIWGSDQRMQCTWQVTWKDVPILSTAMACLTLPQTLGILMMMGLALHIRIFIAAVETDPRSAAEVASLGILSQIQEVHAVIMQKASDKAHSMTVLAEDDTVY